MRALLCRQTDSAPAGLAIGEMAEPEPGTGEVAISIHAAGVNFADTLMIRGRYQEKPPLPFVPGLEVSGAVKSVGAKVDGLEVGQRVLALLGWGGFAETAVAEVGSVFKIPDSMDFVTAAAFPVAYGTAHGALVWQARLQPDETLLVHGAGGGAGLAAVEVGKALGARVIATAGGPDKLAVAADHGADELIDYRRQDIRQRVMALTDGRGADVVFDPVGGEVFDSSMRCVAWGGRLLVIGFAAGLVQQIPANRLLVKNIAALGFYWGSYRRHAPHLLKDQFAQLFAWFDAGKLRPHISHQLPLERGDEALALLSDRKATGKVVLTIRQQA